MKILTLCLIARALAAQQQQPPPRKAFTPPPTPRVAAPVVAKDEACARDFAKMVDLEGLAQRKYFAELLAFECVKPYEGVYYLNVTAIKSYQATSRSVG